MNGNTPPTTKMNPGEFLRQVRQEWAKVTWPSRKETMVTTAMVFVMSILAAIFFFITDWILSHIVLRWIPALLRMVTGS
jgi:preprotein translocase subunit SecE